MHMRIYTKNDLASSLISVDRAQIDWKSAWCFLFFLFASIISFSSVVSSNRTNRRNCSSKLIGLHFEKRETDRCLRIGKKKQMEWNIISVNHAKQLLSSEWLSQSIYIQYMNCRNVRVKFCLLLLYEIMICYFE